MELFLFLIINGGIVFFLFNLSVKQVNSIAKKLLIYGLFFILPFFGSFSPVIIFSNINFTIFRIFLHLSTLTCIVLLLKKRKIIISRSFKLIFIYVIYFFIIAIYRNHFLAPQFLDYFYIMFFFILIENLDYTLKDKLLFDKLLKILSFFIIIIIVIQYFDNSFYIGQQDLSLRSSGNIFYENRLKSLFTMFDYLEAGLSIAFITIIIMNMASYKRLKGFNNILLAGMILATFLTFTRANILVILIGTLFIIYKIKSRLKAIIYITILVLFISIYFYWDSVIELQVVQDRLLSATYMGRYQSLLIFLNAFINNEIILGWGIDSRAIWGLLDYNRPEIHIGYLEILFRSGILGVILFFGFWITIFKRAKMIYKKTNSFAVLACIIGFVLINFFFKYISISYFPYLLILFYLNIEEKVANDMV